MISTLGRIFTVLVAMSSVAFMAFAISRWTTIPDWASEARSMEDFIVTKTEGETPSWSATTRLSGDPVSTSTNAAEVLEAIYKRGTQDKQAELTQLNEEIPLFEADIAEAVKSKEEDAKAVSSRAELLLVEIEQLKEEVNQLTTEAETEKSKAQKLQQTRERRRADVFRVQEELAEAETDQFRALQLQKQLVDMIRRVQGNFVKLQTRHQQLKQSLQ